MVDQIIEELLKLSREELLLELRKMHPQERLIKIKKLEQARKEELEETSKLKKQSIEEVSIDEVVDDVDVPEDLPFDLESLFAGTQSTALDVVDDESNVSYDRNVETIAELYNKLQEVTSGYASSRMEAAKVVYEGILRGEIIQPDSDSIKDIANASRRMMKSFLADYQKHNDYII